MKRFADESALRQFATWTLEYAMADRERRGKPRPVIMTINVGDEVAVLSSETFAQFEHDALMYDDQQGVEEVRRAMATDPGKLVVCAMGPVRNEPCKMVFVVSSAVSKTGG